MPNFAKLLFLGIGLQIFFLTVCSADGQPGIKMHRTNAGTPNSQGWYEANSINGGFSVLMPCLFNDFSTPDVKLTTSGTATVHTIGGRMPDTLAKFSATCLQYSEGEPDKKTLLSEGKPMTYHGCAASQQSGNGRDMGKETIGIIRTIVFEKTACMLIVEYPIQSEEQVKDKIEPFFDSLQFSGGQCSGPDK